ncbi:MAG: hypothetical protein H7252_04850 [Cytophaga sp.]|nr:hypothetical protein [Undibacterium sp.]
MFTTTMLTAASHDASHFASHYANHFASHYSRANHVLLHAGDAACAKTVTTLSNAEQ